MQANRDKARIRGTQARRASEGPCGAGPRLRFGLVFARMRAPFVRILTMLASAVATIVIAAPADDRPVAIVNATIETITKGRIEKGIVLIKAGKIEAVGADVKIPDSARVIDAKGLTVMPGIVDPLCRVGLGGDGGAAGPAAFPRPRTKGGQPQQPPMPTAGFVRVADQFYPYQAVYKSLIRSGITTVSLTPSGLGQSASVRVVPDQPDNMLLAGDGAFYTTVQNSTQSLDSIRTALKNAKAPASGTAKPATPKPEGQPGESKDANKDASGQPPAEAAPASTNQLWADVAAGKRPLFLNVANAASIAHLVKAVEPYPDVKLIVTGQGAGMVQAVEQLKKRKARAILAADIELQPGSRDRLNAARALHEAGIEFAFSLSGSLQVLEATQDAPLFPVAYMVRTGLPRDAALAAVTSRPADMIGLGDRIGSIEPKKDANLLFFSGDPLDPASRLIKVMVEGRFVYEN